jgi:hypothetical protein
MCFIKELGVGEREIKFNAISKERMLPNHTMEFSMKELKKLGKD